MKPAIILLIALAGLLEPGFGFQLREAREARKPLLEIREARKPLLEIREARKPLLEIRDESRLFVGRELPEPSDLIIPEKKQSKAKYFLGRELPEPSDLIIPEKRRDVGEMDKAEMDAREPEYPPLEKWGREVPQSDRWEHAPEWMREAPEPEALDRREPQRWKDVGTEWIREAPEMDESELDARDEAPQNGWVEPSVF